MPHSDMNEREDEMWTDGHPDEGLLHEWLDEQLSAADSERVASHVQSCAQCQAAVAEARGLIAASHRILVKLDEVPAGVIPQNFESPSTPAAPSVDPKVTSIDSASARRSSKSAFRWQRIAPIAAMLLVAVIYARGFDSAKKEPALVTSEPAASSVAPVAAESPMADAVVRSERLTDSAAPTAGSVSQAPQAKEQAAAVAAEPAPLRARSSNGGGASAGPTGRALLGETRVADAERKDAAKKADAVVTQEMVASAAAVAKSSAPLTANSAEPDVAKRALATAPPPPAPSVVSATPPPPSVGQISPATPPATPPVGAGVELSARFRAPVRDAAGGSVGNAAGAPLASPPVVHLVPDSVVLTRNVCAASCETSTLHISSLGVVRLSVGTGASERTVTSQLSPQQRTSLENSVWRGLGTPRTRAFRCVVPAPNVDAAPAVQIVVAYPAPVPVGENRCVQSASEISELAREIDAIAGTELLRQRLRQ